VIIGCACPNLLETTITGIPLFSIKDAAVFRKSWKRISGKPAFIPN